MSHCEWSLPTESSKSKRELSESKKKIILKFEYERILFYEEFMKE